MRIRTRALKLWSATSFSRQMAMLATALFLVGAMTFVSTMTARAAGVVGDGTPASCDGNALAAALLSSGNVTFNCGDAPHVLISNTNVIGAGITLVIDGNNKITIDGEGLRQLFIVSNGAELTLRNIVLTGGGEFEGGAMRIATNGIVTLYKSVVENTNSGNANGGAIYNEGLLDIEQTVVRYNTSRLHGGAIYNTGTLSVRNSWFYNNTATNPTLIQPNGGAIYNLGPLTIERSTFSRNRAENYGGALALKGNAAEIINSTIHENYADRGAGIYADAATGVTVTNSTINANNADTGANIWNSGVPFTILNTIVSNGSTEADNGTPSLDCDGPSITSLGGNIISDGSCINPGLASDQRNTNPKLSFLNDNGGFAATVRPLPDSPAIDKAVDAQCPTIDQRGMTRPQGDHCDVGAFEVGITDTNHHLHLPTVRK